MHDINEDIKCLLLLYVYPLTCNIKKQLKKSGCTISFVNTLPKLDLFNNVPSSKKSEARCCGVSRAKLCRQSRVLCIGWQEHENNAPGKSSFAEHILTNK